METCRKLGFVIVGRCGHVASWGLLFEFLLAREGSHFPLCGKTQKLMFCGRCVAVAGGFKEIYPAE
ncbi:MAG: hypothetical protein II563_05380, partial [Treponema sp.]|nr:hypothetical protein [Treponema sp.]